MYNGWGGEGKGFEIDNINDWKQAERNEWYISNLSDQVWLSYKFYQMLHLLSLRQMTSRKN